MHKTWKKINGIIRIIFFFVPAMFFGAFTVYAQDIYIEDFFKDASFREYVSTKFDTNHDGKLSATEVDDAKVIFFRPTTTCTSLKGVECLKNLTYIHAENGKTDMVDLSQNKNLQTVTFENFEMKTLDVTGCYAMKTLNVAANKIEDIKLEGCTFLENMDCQKNSLKSLSVAGCIRLQELNCDSNNLEEIKLDNPWLDTLYCDNNALKEIDLSHVPNLITLSIRHNFLESLDLSKTKNLMALYCSYNKIEKLDVTQLPLLSVLLCASNKLTTLDLKNNPYLEDLFCDDNKLAFLDLSNNPLLNGSSNFRVSRQFASFQISDNGTFDFATIDGFDVSKASGWNNGTINGTIFTPTKKNATYMYTYKCLNKEMLVDFELYEHQHEIKIVPFQAPDCGKEGNAEYFVCEQCDTWFRDMNCEEVIADRESVILNMTGQHVFDDGKIILKPTCTTKGEILYQCKGCDFNKTEALDKSDHKYEDRIICGGINKAGTVTPTCVNCKKVKKATVIKPITKVSLVKKSFAYDGKKKVPKATLKDDKGNVIPTMFYKVSVSATPKKVGTYKAKITLRGLYKGTKTLSYTIVPKGTSFVSVKPNKKAITLAWKKQTTQVDGYEIQYSTSEKFATYATKKLSIKKDSTVSKKVKNLKAKKKYYVRIRTYKKVNGKTYYSDWSKTKSVVTK